MIEQGFIFSHDFGPRSGHLQEGKRLVLIVQSDLLNRIQGLSTFIVVPMTTKHKPAPTFIKVEPSSNNRLTATSWAITNQIYTVDEGDLVEHIGKVSRAELIGVKEALKRVLGLS